MNTPPARFNFFSLNTQIRSSKPAARAIIESTMNPASRLLCKVTIEDPVSAAREISILMGNDTVVRRQWVEENVNFNEIDTFVDEVK